MTFRDELLARFEPYLQDDDGSLDTLIQAWTTPFEAIDQAVRYGDDDEPFAGVLDPLQTPAFLLTWLAQFVGQKIPDGTSEADARALIQHPSNWHRGTVAAIIDATSRTLVDAGHGPPSVFVFERTKPDLSPDPAYIYVLTYTDETPNPTATAAAALSQKRIGIIMNVAQTTRHNWQTLLGDYATWDAAKAAFANWGALKAGA